MGLNLIITDVDLTLMVMDANGDYNPSTVMTYQYFIIAPDSFTTDLLQKTRDLMIAIYNEHYHVFRQREPNDVNYIAVVGLRPLILHESDYPYQPWLKGRSPQWESSNCIVVNESGYHKMAPNIFGALLGVA